MPPDSDPGPQAGVTSAVVEAPPGPVQQLYHQLEERVRASRPREDLTPLRKAFEFARERHGNQKRSSGDPYIVHPLEVTLQLAD
ncbi:MAG TPA: hypothetical protein VGF59_04725, partial [Bryobacteraceae bacterium]